MGTSYAEDTAHYQHVVNNYAESGKGKALGNVQLAGVHWAQARKTHGTRVDEMVKEAFKEAGALLEAGYLKAKAAISSGDEEAGLLMKKWFGTRYQAVGGLDTWQGAKRILGHLQSQLAQPVKLYYRGDNGLLGLTSDYPNDNSVIVAQDLVGFAETMGSAENGDIGLCSTFFKKDGKGAFGVNKTGFDSIGGTIVHELSHNRCGTEDHESMTGGDCYGTADCMALAVGMARRAWYNADNIEYFCEEAHYGIVAAKVDFVSGLLSAQGNMQAARLQLRTAMNLPPPPTVNVPQPIVLKPSQNVSQMKAQFMMTAVAKNPGLTIDTGAQSSVSSLRSLWK